MLNFTTTGQLLSEVAVPAGFELAGDLSSTLAGKWPKTEEYEKMLFRFHDAEIDVGSGKVVWDRFYAADLVDSYIQGAKRIGGGIGPSEEQIEEYRTLPKVWYRPRLRLDDSGRLWALSTRVENDLDADRRHRVRHGLVHARGE